MPLSPTHRSLAVVLALCAAQAAASAPAPKAAPDAGTAPDSEECERLYEAASRELAAHRRDSALQQATAGLARCGPGAGFHLLLGTLAVGRMDPEAASRHFEQELRWTPHGREAFWQLMLQFPRLSPARQRELSTWGGSPETALPVRTAVDAKKWLTLVACPGGRLDRLDLSRASDEGLGSYGFECPVGSPRRVYFHVQWDPPQTPPVPEASQPNAVQRLIPALSSMYPVRSIEDLKRTVGEPLKLDRQTGLLMSWLKDAPSELRIFRERVRANPDDLEAVLSTASAQYVLGDVRGALATLMAANEETVAIFDTSGGSLTSTSALLTNRCRMLRLLGRNREALVQCQKSVERGSKVGGPHELAIVLFLLGKDAEALAQIDQSLANNPRLESARFVRGLLLRFMGREQEALEAWEGASSFYRPTIATGLRRTRTRAEWIRAADAHAQDSYTQGLARCGHYYLELEMPERAAACIAAVERVDRGIMEAERVEHLAETDPEGAVRAAEQALRTSRHPNLLRAKAFAERKAGQVEQAMRTLEEASKAELGGWTAKP